MINASGISVLANLPNVNLKLPLNDACPIFVGKATKSSRILLGKQTIFVVNSKGMHLYAITLFHLIR